MIITSPLYDILKRVVQVVLPACSSLYFGLAAIWDLPAAEQVVGTIAVITTFLGVCLGISSKNYQASDLAYDGSMIVTDAPDGKRTLLMEFNSEPIDLVAKDAITFKVKAGNAPPPEDE